MEAGSLGIQIGENIDIVILSLDKNNRSKLFSGRFAIGLDASAAWGNGKSSRGNKALYGKPIKNGEIVEGGAATPAVAQRFASKLTSLLHPESSTP